MGGIVVPGTRYRAMNKRDIRKTKISPRITLIKDRGEFPPFPIPSARTKFFARAPLNLQPGSQKAAAIWASASCARAADARKESS